MSPTEATYRRTIFIGDSTVRQLYYATAKLLDGGRGGLPINFESGEKHSDKQVVLTNGMNDMGIVQETLSLEFWWYVHTMSH
jgi:hypothetical protein